MIDVTALLDEAFERPTEGWDFRWLGDRLRQEAFSWCYEVRVDELTATATSLLDLGTGGGEWLAGRSRRPRVTVATESWWPNVGVAAARLAPLHVNVVAVEGGPDNVDQVGDGPTLPFREGVFDVVSDRHESFVAGEVCRVLRTGGHFVTEQVGDGRYDDIRRLLGEAPSERPPLRRELLVGQLHAAGLRIVDALDETVSVRVADVGALAWYVRMAPWIVPGFSREGHERRLRELDRTIERDGPLSLSYPGTFIVAKKP